MDTSKLFQQILDKEFLFWPQQVPWRFFQLANIILHDTISWLIQTDGQGIRNFFKTLQGSDKKYNQAADVNGLIIKIQQLTK